MFTNFENTFNFFVGTNFFGNFINCQILLLFDEKIQNLQLKLDDSCRCLFSSFNARLMIGVDVDK